MWSAISTSFGRNSYINRRVCHRGRSEQSLRIQNARALAVGAFQERNIVVRFINTVMHRGRRGARPARREEGEYREYLTDEQRSGTGCIGGRMPLYL